MKIFLTGGGTGGHFYPVLAVIRALKKIAEEERFVEMSLLYMADDPFDLKTLGEEGVRFVSVPAGKVRRYFSFLNFTDSLKTLAGIIRAVTFIFWRMPDVIFAKGGYSSFPALIAARFFRIPVIIHESDAVPGRVNRWASKFARRVAVSFAESAKFFPESKTALVGNPIRTRVLGGNIEEARSVFGPESLPTILFLGGSQGASKLNDVVMDVLPELLPEVRIIHQCGPGNFDDVSKRSSVILDKNQFKDRYKLFKFMDEDVLRNASLVSDLIISRAGAGAIFEIAAWGKPSILIPLPSSAQDHQRENAYAYARTGAALVIEESNLTPHILMVEVKKILQDKIRRETMSKYAKSFSKTDAAEKLAREIIALAMEHAA